MPKMKKLMTATPVMENTATAINISANVNALAVRMAALIDIILHAVLGDQGSQGASVWDAIGPLAGHY